MAALCPSPWTRGTPGMRVSLTTPGRRTALSSPTTSIGLSANSSYPSTRGETTAVTSMQAERYRATYVNVRYHINNY